ncbi:MAG: type I-U CRISPR-associated protein Cas7 [Bifidobacteriaceae bacterium]|jgi:CRISPR-associated protein Csb1|nr:type I-U CRISPR-associated protein Cas7 [Bifidobacteriaceae bacterium]
MANLDFNLLLQATSAGGPSALSATTPLAPAAGPQAAIAPAKYASPRGDLGTYVYEVRFVDGEAVHTVLIDSAQSSRNRMEIALVQAIDDGNAVLGRLPRIRVTYERDGLVESYTDLELPHRAFDAHVRAGTVDGKPVTQHAAYRAARDSSPANAWDLLNLSPCSLALGSWDASRKARQGRWPSVVTGEIIGVLTDQGGATERSTPKKGGARVDPIGMSAQLDGATLEALAVQQEDELSAATFKKVVDGARKLKAGEKASASALGFGGIPPTLSQLGAVSCRAVTRTQVVSFASLRQIRFGKGPEGDAALRAVLAALALNGLTRSNAELYIRANCHLVEAGPTRMVIDQRGGSFEELEPSSIEQADALLDAAISHAAHVAGLDWHGQCFDVAGNPAVLAGAADETPED